VTLGRWIVVCRPGAEAVAWLTVALSGEEVAGVRGSPLWDSDDFLLIPAGTETEFPGPPFDLDG
jgi:hypothetical protein